MQGWHAAKKSTTAPSSPRTTPLAEICKAWEGAAKRIERLGLRVAIPRIGVVLGRDGGALERMEKPARMRASVVLGSGKQMVSWIHVHDLCRAIAFLLEQSELDGPLQCDGAQPP